MLGAQVDWSGHFHCEQLGDLYDGWVSGRTARIPGLWTGSTRAGWRRNRTI